MQNHKTDSQKILQHLEEAQNILIVSHKKPDGDTLGSNFALAELLISQNKKTNSFCLDTLPFNMQFLPHSHLLSSDQKLFSQKYDTIITVDSGSLDYAGVDKLIEKLPNKPTLINIDHHASNPGYGDINLVIPSASSTAEIIYLLFKEWKIKVSENQATNLACGLITDTTGFKNLATNYTCMSAAGDLINKGANINRIVKATINNLNINSLTLWGRALERLEKNNKYNIVYTYLTQQDFIECQASDSDGEGIANFLHVLKEGEIIMILRQVEKNTIKGSLRTTGNVDLSKLAQAFGGGGHKKASGFSLSGHLKYDNNKLKIV